MITKIDELYKAVISNWDVLKSTIATSTESGVTMIQAMRYERKLNFNPGSCKKMKGWRRFHLSTSKRLCAVEDDWEFATPSLIITDNDVDETNHLDVISDMQNNLE
eukprot:jgi/Psemu1/37094/gm1.37094_g